MRYIKHYLEEIANVEIYPLISLLIFFLFFVGLTLYVFLMRKQHVEYMSARPLDADDADGHNDSEPQSATA